jgi:hypothetical protein
MLLEIECAFKKNLNIFFRFWAGIFSFINYSDFPQLSTAGKYPISGEKGSLFNQIDGFRKHLRILSAGNKEKTDCLFTAKSSYFSETYLCTPESSLRREIPIRS